MKAGVKSCINKALKHASPPDKHSALTRDGAISAPGLDLSVEISPCKLSSPNACARGEGEALVAWQSEFSRDSDVGINWRQEFADALPDEGIPRNDAYLVSPEGELPRDMIREEVVANWQDVNKAKVKEIAGLYDFGCFQRYFRAKAHNIIDVRWVITRKTFEGSVGARCRFTVRGFKGKFQDFDTYPERPVVPAKGLPTPSLLKMKCSFSSASTWARHSPKV